MITAEELNEKMKSHEGHNVSIKFPDGHAVDFQLQVEDILSIKCEDCDVVVYTKD